PDDFDHVPARAAKTGLQLLDDLAVPADRPVEPLQIAVDDEDQVIELLAHSQIDGAERFGLVDLAVPDETPDLLPRGVHDPAMMQVMKKASLINSHDRPQPHRDGGKLPEAGHQPGMWVRRKPPRASQLAAEVTQLLLGNSPFKIGPRVHPRRSVPLKIDEV